MDKAHLRGYFLAIVTALITILTVYMFSPFLVTLGMAAVSAVVLNPLRNRIAGWKFSDTITALITVTIGLIVATLITSFFGVQLFREAQSVYSVVSEPGAISHAQQSLISFGQSLNGTLPGSAAYFTSLAANLGEYVKSGLGASFAYAGIFVSGTLTFILHLFVFVMTLYYLIKERSHLEKIVERFSPLSKEETDTLSERMIETIASVVRGALLVSVVLGLVTTISFAIFGIPNAVLWGTIGIIASLIPALGTSFVVIGGIIYLVLIGHVTAAIGLAVLGLGAVAVIDNAVRPYLMKGKTSIHPLLILLAVLGGILFFGPAGLFLGPLVISLLLGLLSLYASPTTTSTTA